MSRTVVVTAVTMLWMAGVVQAQTPTAAQWPTLNAEQKARALMSLERAAAQGPAPMTVLAIAARDPDEAIARRALGVLGRTLPTSRTTLQGLFAHDATRLGAAKTLLRHDETAGHAAIASWLQSEPDTDQITKLAFALRDQDVSTRASLVKAALKRELDFAGQWRLAQSAHEVPEATPWLTDKARGADTWMVRAEALKGLPTEQTAERLAALIDAVPRVREAAASTLHVSNATLAPLAKTARTDRWPRVRMAALSRLASHADARPVLVAAIDDPSHLVRAHAIAALEPVSDPKVAAAVIGRLKDEREWTDVLVAAAKYVGQQCIADATPALEARVQRARQPGASPGQVDAGAVSLVALGRLGRAQALSQSISNGPAPAALKHAAARPQKLCGAKLSPHKTP